MVCGVLENNRQQMTRLFSVRRQPLRNSSASRIGMSAAAAVASRR